MLNFDKNGIVIFSQYRSGGTQLTQILGFIAESLGKNVITCGEISVDLSRFDFEHQIEQNLYGIQDDFFKIYLINDPVIVSYIYSTNYVENILENYEGLVLTRSNIEKTLLSLGLWEDIIDKGYFKEFVYDEDLRNHHEYRIKNPLHLNTLSVGHNGDIYRDDKQEIITLKTNYKLASFLNSQNILNSIAFKYSLLKLNYEQFEESPEFIYNLSSTPIEEFYKNKIVETYRYKIPYISDNYSDYYDKDTTKALENWKLKNH